MIIKRSNTGTDISSPISELIVNSGTTILWASIQHHKTVIAYTYNDRYWAVVHTQNRQMSYASHDALEAILMAQRL